MKISKHLADQGASGSPIDSPEKHLEVAIRDSMQLRRDLLRWKQLALESEQELKAIKLSYSWRATGPLRLIPNLRKHLKPLCLAIAISIVTLPLWPIVAIMMLFKTGRRIIWSLLLRLPSSVLDLLMLIKVRILGSRESIVSRGVAAQSAPLIFSRLADDASVQYQAGCDQNSWHALQLLSPQKRHLLDGLMQFQPILMAETENPEHHSLAASEASIMQLSIAAQNRSEQQL